MAPDAAAGGGRAGGPTWNGASPTDPLPADLAEFAALLTTHSLGREVVFLAETDSTMRVAREAVAAGAPHGLVVLADHQHAGRGRQGRTWEDAPGASVLASLVVRPGTASAVPPTRIVMALAIGVAEGLTALGLGPRLKWPNDVRIGGRKVAGMLAVGTGGAVVLGLGLNVRCGAVPASLGALATSVEAEAERAGRAVPTRADVLTAVLGAAEPWFDRAADARALVARYTALLDGLGEPIALDTGAASGALGAVVTGTFEGVDDDGALRLRGADGVIRRHHAGDVHIRRTP